MNVILDKKLLVDGQMVEVKDEVSHMYQMDQMLVVTEEEKAVSCLNGLQRVKNKNFRICGIVIEDTEKIGEVIHGVKVVSSAENMIDYIRRHVVDTVFISLKDKKKEKDYAGKISEMGVTVHVYQGGSGSGISAGEKMKFGALGVRTIRVNHASAFQMSLKRIIDIAGCLPGLILAGTAFLVFAPVIWIQSPGPILFSQIRVGKNGRKFKMYKFRSMYPDAEKRKKELMKHNKMKGLMFKMDNDPRIFPIGRFMRSTSIDELPQFWNVLKGEMSLVGTRPPTVDEYEQYQTGHKIRLSMKPGITGMWQVSGRSDIRDFEEVVRMDAGYITGWRLGLDIKILFQTVKAVMMKKGAV